MNALMNIMKTIDKYIFNQVDSFKESKYYEHLMNFTGQLTESKQRLFKYFFSCLCIIPPALLVVFLGINLLILENTYYTKKEIQNTIKTFMNQKGRLQSLQKKVLNPRASKSKEDLTKSLKKINISPGTITVKRFKSKTFENASKIKQVNAELKFSKLALEDFVTLTKQLIKVNKMRIQGIEINRGSKNRLLSGTINILQYTKK